MALFLDVGPNDVLRLDDDTTICIDRKSGSRARLRIEGSSKVILDRGGRDKPPEKKKGDGDGRDT